MKKLIFLLLICFIVTPCLFAQVDFVYDGSSGDKGIFSIPNRFFEGGFDLGASLTNNILSMDKIFTNTIVLDFDDLKKGLKLNIDADARIFFNINNGGDWGLGFYGRVEGTGALGLSGSLLSFTEANGDKSDLNGALFFSCGVNAHLKLFNFRIKLRPAMYYTLAYVKPDVSYTFLNAENGTTFNIAYDMFLYTGFPMDGFPGNIDFTGSPGFDFSFGIEYPLAKVIGLNKTLPFLDFDVGLDVINIPIYASTTREYMRQQGRFGSSEPFYVINDELMGEGSSGFGDIFNHTSSPPVYGNEEMSVERPFKVMLSANWRPLLGSSLLTITPMLGFSISQLYLNPFHLEVGLNARLNIANLVIVSAGVNYFDRIWINSLTLALNIRAIQLDIGIDMRSQDFIKSWTASGLGLKAGLRFGW